MICSNLRPFATAVQFRRTHDGSFHLVAAPPAHSLHPPPAAVVLGALRPQAARRLVGSTRCVKWQDKRPPEWVVFCFGTDTQNGTGLKS